MTICTRCDKPPGAYFCWNGLDLDCPFRLPPRHLTLDDLWPIVVELRATVQKLSEG